jgi:XTP/dITP diphosphohydrolase
METHHQHDLLLASTNGGKIRELTQLLDDMPVNLHNLAEFPELSSVEETGETFEENAAIKAVFYGRLSGLLTLADDSGLEVEALGGRPGVRSARYAGVNATDEQRMIQLLEELKRTGAQHRSARFVCVMALYQPLTADLELFKGICLGRIAAEARGSNGFGYDPIFIPNGYDASFAELPSLIKGQISHRARALAEVHSYLLSRFELTYLPDENAR